jgi:uncharacterized LabA/DUF88 family protein
MTAGSRKTRVACFIDGFNLYHAVDDLRDDSGQSMHYLKWLDLRSLASAFVPPRTQRLEKVFYFSAYATWLRNAYERHRSYTAALEARGVTLVMGKFKEKKRRCRACGSEWIAHEEKESDVNFAVELVNQAHIGGFDRALLVTADSDLCPAIRLVRRLFPQLYIQVLTPPGGYDLARELRGLVPTVRIRRKHLRQNLLPDEIHLPSGRTVVRPEKYKLPANPY